MRRSSLAALKATTPLLRDSFGYDQDRNRFLETLAQTCEKTGWQVHAFCLMSNHFHPSRRQGWLRVDRLLGEWGIPKDSPAGRRQFSRLVEQRRGQETCKTDWKAVERGWCLGDTEFKEELLAQMRERRGDNYGPELREADSCMPSGGCGRNCAGGAGRRRSWSGGAKGWRK